MVAEIQMFECDTRSYLDFCLRVWIKSEVYKRKVDTRDDLFALILDVADHIKTVKIYLDEQHAIFAHECKVH
jgi:hypothetical protein